MNMTVPPASAVAPVAVPPAFAAMFDAEPKVNVENANPALLLKVKWVALLTTSPVTATLVGTGKEMVINAEFVALEYAGPRLLDVPVLLNTGKNL